MKKRLLSFLFSMALLVLFVPAALAVPQAQADTTSAEVSTWSALCEALQVDGNSIVLADDVKFGEGAGDHASAVLTVPAGTTVTLDLAGHVVDRGLTSAVADGSVFDVSGTLIITDSSPNATHEEPITYTDPNDAENTTTVTGGVITGGYALAHRISSGTNYAGGGVLVRDGARLVMTGGAICNNRAEVGEGSGNGGGGGVAVMSGGALDMSGNSRICGNVSNRDGGGVFMYSGTLAMAGDAKICANAADDAGGQYGHGGGACAHGSVVTMTGNAAIANNKADGYGGGLQ